ncbi:MAG: DUF4382 domain-containing protein [Chitinophagaceae bacterium]
MKKTTFNNRTIVLTDGRDNSILNTLIVLGIAITLIFFSACKKPGRGSSNTSPQTGFEMRMTDAPGDYGQVNVEIVGAEVHSDINGWTSLNVKAGIYNLLDLTNGKDTLIATGQVAVGKISQIRLTLGSNNTVLFKGNTYPLKTPSGQQSGIKLQVNATLLAGINYSMLIDFDADKSIVQTGDGKFILKPVIRVVNKSVDGAISGIILPQTANPAVYAISGTDTFSTYANALSGGFMISGLKAGTYQLQIRPKAPYRDSTLNGITVNVGTVTNTGITILQ